MLANVPKECCDVNHNTNERNLCLVTIFKMLSLVVQPMAIAYEVFYFYMTGP